MLVQLHSDNKMARHADVSDMTGSAGDADYSVGIVNFYYFEILAYSSSARSQIS
jgi:hypothetical protein